MKTLTLDKPSKLYKDIQSKLKCLYTDLKLTDSKEQKNYIEMEILVLEEFISKTISKGRF